MSNINTADEQLDQLAFYWFSLDEGPTARSRSEFSVAIGTSTSTCPAAAASRGFPNARPEASRSWPRGWGSTGCFWCTKTPAGAATCSKRC